MPMTSDSASGPSDTAVNRAVRDRPVPKSAVLEDAVVRDAVPAGAIPDDAVPVGAPLLTPAELFAGITDRRPMLDAPGKSGARLERVTIDGEPFVVKILDRTEDWTIRASGVPASPVVVLWSRGVLHRLPECFDQPVVAVAVDPDPDHLRYPRRTILLMRDVGDDLIPVGDEPIDLATEHRLLDHMAALHAAFWDPGPDVEVVAPMHRYLELSPWTAQTEAALGARHPVAQLIERGWPLLAEVAPAAARVVTPLAWDPGPLVERLSTTPETFVHGCLKFDNLGTDASGRTVILDWELSGKGAPLSDLAWYLAINCRRLPESKEAAIDWYRSCLERRGVNTEPWWQLQLDLCLLGGLVQFGWEKAFAGYDDELRWWEQRALAGAALLS